MQRRAGSGGSLVVVAVFLGLIGAGSFGVESLEGQEEATGPEAAWRAAARWDVVDEAATVEIHKHTTDPRYLTPLVSYLPADESVPAPHEVLGYVVGAEGKLTRPEDEIRYFQALADASPRVELHEIGRTEEGRTMHLVVISDEANLSRIDQLKAHTAALADPRATDEVRAVEIAAAAKPIVYLTAGLHSSETGPSEMVMELAYRLAVSNHPDIQAIRQNVITLITPILEVDGRARQVDWYYRYLTEYDNRYYRPTGSPPYWGKYVFHDNNRDGIQVTQKLTQNFYDMFFEWHPTYSLDLHESVPLLYVSTGTGPYNTTLDPVLTSEWQWIASWEVTELNKQGLPGVWTWGFYTGWNPSYLLWIANNHNSLGRFYETFGNSSARTMKRDLSDATYAGKKVTSQQWYRANPPDDEIVWSLRNNTNYMQSGVLASLTLAARNGPTLLYNFWKKGANSIVEGGRTAPYGWVIPGQQRDRARLAYLVNQLRRHGIEVHQAGRAFTLDGKEHAKGDFVVKLDQPYGRFARNLLAIQQFPADADQQPYDDVSWSLGLLYGVETVPVSDSAIFGLRELTLVSEEVRPSGVVAGGRAGFVLENTGQNGLITARVALRDFEVLATEEPFTMGKETFPRGSWILPQQEDLRPVLERLATELGLDFHPLTKRPEVETHSLDLPRLALYHNWVSTQADGWTRYTLERAGVPYDYINDDHIKAGGLRERYDVILMAHQGGSSAKRLVHGLARRFGPMPYTRESGFSSHGVIDSSPDITGGIGFGGLSNLEQFLDGGGTLILLGSAGRLATDFGLLQNVGTLTSDNINTPGSSLRAKVRRRDHPIAYGFEDVHPVFRTNGPVYTVAQQYEHWIVVQYGTKEKAEKGKDENGSADAVPKELLIAGLVKGASALERRAVVLDVPRHAGGRVLLYSFNPVHRYLNHADHNYLYNAILNWNDLPDPQPEEHPGLARD